MKQLRKFLSDITCLIILSGIIAFGGWKFLNKSCPPDGFILVQESFIDSLQKVASMPPDTVYKDTIIVLPDTTKHEYASLPKIKPINDSINYQKDSLVTPFYTVWVEDWIQNNASIKRNWHWTDPGYKVITKEIHIPKLYPVPIEVYKADPRTKQLWASGLIGTQGKGIPFGGQLTMIDKKTSYIVQYQRIDKQDYLLIGAGFKIVSW